MFVTFRPHVYPQVYAESYSVSTHCANQQIFTAGKRFSRHAKRHAQCAPEDVHKR